jgi:radical SAM superfamily enzyme YgiQ (UPF0313 family)
MQSLCNQSVTRKMSWSVGMVAGVMIDAHRDDYHYMDIRPLAIMKTSWGCPYACTFCYN